MQAMVMLTVSLTLRKPSVHFQDICSFAKGGWTELEALDLSDFDMSPAAAEQLVKAQLPHLKALSIQESSGPDLEPRHRIFRQSNGKWPLLEKFSCISRGSLTEAEVTALVEIQWLLLKSIRLQVSPKAWPVLARGNWPILQHVAIVKPGDEHVKGFRDHFVWSTVQHLEFIDCDITLLGVYLLAKTHLPHLKQLTMAYGTFIYGWNFAYLLRAWPRVESLSLDLARNISSESVLGGLVSCILPYLQTFKICIRQLHPGHLTYILQVSWPRLTSLIIEHSNSLPVAFRSQVLDECRLKWPGLSFLDVHKIRQEPNKTHSI